MTDRWYVYIFVRTDLSPEQQVVQSSHVCWNTALTIQKIQDMCCKEGVPGCDLYKLYFRVIGIDNTTQLDTVRYKLCQQGVDVHVYHEADMNDEVTAVATFPVKFGEENCNWLYRTYNDQLLTFKK